MKEALKLQLITFLRQLAVAVLTAVIVVTGLIVGFAEENAQERQTFQELRNATLAQVCVLALPVSSVTGRDPEDVRECLERYELVP